MDAGELVPDEVTTRWSAPGSTSRTPARASSSTAFPAPSAGRRARRACWTSWACRSTRSSSSPSPTRSSSSGCSAAGRSDDTEDVIRNRQKVYRDETAPLLDHYRAKLVSVDAVGAVDEVTRGSLDALPRS